MGALRVLHKRHTGEMQPLWSVRLTPALFLRFCAFVERCGHSPHAISIFYGSCRVRNKWSSSGQPAHPLLVENPCRRNNGTNLAQCVQRRYWQETIRCCEQARGVITASLYD